MGGSSKDTSKSANEKEVKDYGYGEVTTTSLGGVSTRIFTGPIDKNGNSPYFDTKGRGAQG